MRERTEGAGFEVEVTDAMTAACTLMDCGEYAAVRLTIDLGELWEQTKDDPDGTASLLLHAIGDAWDVTVTPEGKAQNLLIIEKAELPRGVTAEILVDRLPEVLDEDVKGVTRRRADNA